MSATSPNPTQFATTQPGGSGDHTPHNKITFGGGTGASGVTTPVTDNPGERLPVGGALIGTAADTSAVASILGRLLKLSEQLPPNLTPGTNFRTEIMVDNSGVPTGNVAMAASIPITGASDQRVPLRAAHFSVGKRFADADNAQSNNVLYTPTSGKKPVVTGFNIQISEDCTVPILVALAVAASSIPTIGTTAFNNVIYQGKLPPGASVVVNGPERLTGSSVAVNDKVLFTCDDPVGGHVTVIARGYEE